jgi:hypothetical protein
MVVDTAGWRVMLRSYWWISILCLLTLAVTILPITWLAIHPIRVEIEQDRVALYRVFPGDTLGLPRPRLSYVETVRPLSPEHNGGHWCEKTGGPARYTNAEPVGRWSISWADTCLSDPVGYTWSAYWTLHMGVLRLGATGISTSVLRAPCDYRISGNGIIHQRGSPHFAQTSQARCFSTYQEAEASLQGAPDDR